ncbi:MAG: hypothetical protein IT328_08125 [Caldilineaceae bacterium]|nr:hypothetical protein [Caldilineaceae bacterium]
MTLSDFRRITDELLSAYIDGEVSEQERTLVEAAIAADEEIAWRLNSLRQTVTLLRELPELALPRSFTLTLDQAALSQADGQLAGVTVGLSPTGQTSTGQSLAGGPTPRAKSPSAPKATTERASSPGFWGQLQQGWREFWQAGNPVLRNAAAVSFALMLFLMGGGQILNRALTQPAGMMASAPAMDSAAAPASEAAPAAVAILPTASPDAAPATEEEARSGKLPTQESAVPAQPDAAPESATGEAAEVAASDTAVSSARVAAASEAAEESAVVDEGEAAVSEAAPAAPEEQVAEEQATVAATVEEPAAAAAMAAPMEVVPQGGGGPPFAQEQMPLPGMPDGRGSGGGLGGGGPEMAQGYGAPDTGMPAQAYTFDANPMPPTAAPAEEAVSVSAAAVPQEPPAEVPEDMAATPAVDAPATQSAPVATATPSEVALVAPEAITSSTIVQNVPVDEPGDGAVAVTGPARNLPVLWVAQGSTIFLTLVLASLWWRSRTARRQDQ